MRHAKEHVVSEQTHGLEVSVGDFLFLVSFVFLEVFSSSYLISSRISKQIGFVSLPLSVMVVYSGIPVGERERSSLEFSCGSWSFVLHRLLMSIFFLVFFLEFHLVDDASSSSDQTQLN